jgi:hypothetical protein
MTRKRANSKTRVRRRKKLPVVIIPAWKVEHCNGMVVPIYARCGCCDEILGIRDETEEIQASEVDWEEHGEQILCSDCAKDIIWNEWIESVLDVIEEAANIGNWSFNRDRYSGGFNTQSRYYTLTHKVSDRDLKIRISDHGTAHCSEDYSIAMNPSGDDHPLEYVVEKLKGTLTQ